MTGFYSEGLYSAFKVNVCVSEIERMTLRCYRYALSGQVPEIVYILPDVVGFLSDPCPEVLSIRSHSYKL